MSAQRSPGTWMWTGYWSQDGKQLRAYGIVARSDDGWNSAVAEIPVINPTLSEQGIARARADAMFIVKSCNSHDGLVAYLAAIENALHTYDEQQIGPAGLITILRRQTNEARTALAKVVA